MRIYCVKFVAANGDVCKHEYPDWFGAKSMIEFLRISYRCKGYVCDDADDDWVKGWCRKELFKKDGRPDLFIRYWKQDVELK